MKNKIGWFLVGRLVGNTEIEKFLQFKENLQRLDIINAIVDETDSDLYYFYISLYMSTETKRIVTFFSEIVDVSMDGELARGTLINGPSLATTFAPDTNTKAL